VNRETGAREGRARSANAPDIKTGNRGSAIEGRAACPKPARHGPRSESGPYLCAGHAAWHNPHHAQQRHGRRVVGSTVLLAQATGPLSQMSLPTVSRSTSVRHVVPAWVAMPPTARILTSAGLELRPLRNSAVTDEHTRVGVLVGALTNTGRCARQVRAFLQYTDDRWRPIGDPIESEARVSEVAPDGLLPYRFRLKRIDDFATPPSAFLLQVVEDGQPVESTLEWVSRGARVDRSPCAAPVTTVSTQVSESRSTLRGYRVAGAMTVETGGPLRLDGVTLTALLRDASGDVLDVLVGVPRLDPKVQGPVSRGASVPFVLTTSLPLGKSVASATVFAGVLPDAAPAER
jgi:hypothetical protein